MASGRSTLTRSTTDRPPTWGSSRLARQEVYPHRQGPVGRLRTADAPHAPQSWTVHECTAGRGPARRPAPDAGHRAVAPPADRGLGGRAEQPLTPARSASAPVPWTCPQLPTAPPPATSSFCERTRASWPHPRLIVKGTHPRVVTRSAASRSAAASRPDSAAGPACSSKRVRTIRRSTSSGVRRGLWCGRYERSTTRRRPPRGAGGPLVDRLAADAELLGDLTGHVALIDPPRSHQPGVLGQTSMSVRHREDLRLR